LVSSKVPIRTSAGASAQDSRALSAMAAAAVAVLIKNRRRPIPEAVVVSKLLI
jgi:hypothetical protein